MKSYDFVIVGAGIVGLTIARSILRNRMGSVCLLEKEASLGKHSSGRNSGVLHAGIYYPPNSLKAKVCSTGAKALREYAAAHAIPCEKVGKVVVAATAQEAVQVDALYQNALKNGVRAEIIDAQKLKQIEPLAATHEKALYSPDTAIIDPKVVLDTIQSEITRDGAVLMFAEPLVGVDTKNSRVRTKHFEIGYGHLINAAGLHADRVAHAMGAGREYRILPFKGLYKNMTAEFSGKIRGLIYPAPDLSVPFLGIHLTKTISGKVTAGPTAIPAFGRENYEGLQGIRAKDFLSIAKDLSVMTAQNRDGFRTMAARESFQFLPGRFLNSLRRLAPSVSSRDISGPGKVGIRAQLVNVKTMKLVMDFVTLDAPNSTHILNAISPAFTSSFAFAERITEKIRGVRGLQELGV